MPEAELVGKYMIWPVFSLAQLSLLDSKIAYRLADDVDRQEPMDYLEFIARVTSHIPTLR